MEQQGGRFLERSRKDGFWYQVPYKRAVDKTSQGLRERERGDEDTQAPVAVPAQFTGKQAHKLSDLADVAMAHAHRADGLPRSASGLVTSSKPYVPTKASPRKSSTAAASRAAPVPSPGTTTPRDLSPLPPTMEMRQSSMFRLLKDTKLLPAESAHVLAPITPQPGSTAAMTAAAAIQRSYAPQSSAAQAAAFYQGLVKDDPGYAAAAAPAGTTAAPSAVGAPALTRLTTQVSDWLNSFWPVPPTAGKSGAPGSIAPAPPRVAPPIVNIPPPAPAGDIKITTIPPLKTNGHRQSKTAAAASLPQQPTATSQPPAIAALSTSLKEPPSTATTSGSTAEESLDVGAPPTELEHSVSATLLKLATQPSRFFSGISALFGEDEPPPKMTTTAPPLAGTKRSQGSLLDDDDEVPIVTAGMKKRRTSLLDDYEETPMEARMRSIS